MKGYEKAVKSQEMIEDLSNCLSRRCIILLLNNKNFAGSQLKNQIRNQALIIQSKIAIKERNSLLFESEVCCFYIYPKLLFKKAPKLRRTKIEKSYEIRY